jgi:hypothetical protein
MSCIKNCLHNSIKVKLYVNEQKQNLYKPQDLTNKQELYYKNYEGI